MKYQLRVLPLEPTAQGFTVPPALPLAALDGIERAALALIEAVRLAKGSAVPAPGVALSSTPAHTVLEVCNEFLFAKARAGRSENYLRVTLAQLRALCDALGASPISALPAAAIEHWLYSREWSEHTRLNHLRTVRTVFAFGVARGYLVGNAALAVDLPTLPDKPPVIHAPEIVAEVLETARRLDLNVCRWLAVRYFAGLRASEASSLSEECIQTERGFIEVTAARAKTRRRRLVEVQPNLAAWLGLGGKLPLHQVNNRVRALTAALPVKFERNATRHSFCSYHLAHFGSAALTALQAGHTEQVLFNHYREIVTKEDADKFWQICPLSSPSPEIKTPVIES